MVRQQAIDLVRQSLRVGEVHQPDRAATDLVFIGRADAALGRADGIGLGGVLADRIELTMQRQDQGDVFGNTQIVGRNLHALSLQLVEFGDEGLRVEHNAVADHRQL